MNPMPHSPRNRTDQRLAPQLRQRYGYVIGSILALSLCTTGLLYWQQLKPDGLSYYAGTFEEVLDQAALGDRLCFVKFESDFCYPCQQLDTRLKYTPGFAESLAGNYLLYRVDPFNSYLGGRDLARRYQIRELPTLLITDSEGRELTRLEGLADSPRLQALLEQHAALRVAPARQAVMPARLAVPIASDSSFEEQRHFGLVIGQYDSFVTARRAALQRRRQWNQAVWIQAKRFGSQFQLVLGTFDERREARMTKRFLKVWEKEESSVVALRPIPLEIAPPPAHLPSAKQ
jgi:hypothetical protein